MHAPHGPATGSSRPDADGRAAPPRLTLRGRIRPGGGRTAGPRDEAAGPHDEHVGPRRAGTTELVDTAPDDPISNGGSDAELDWRAVSLFGAGVAIGALLGAGAALLMAPASGFETRMRLVRTARQAGERANDRWDELGNRVRLGARRSRRNLERKLIRARWRAQDAWEQKRYADE